MLSLPLTKKSNFVSAAVGQPDVACSKRETAVTNTKSYLWAFLSNVFHFITTGRKPSDKSRMWGQSARHVACFSSKNITMKTQKGGGAVLYLKGTKEI